MNILFTICGRAGSKGFKNKNLKELNGVPLVYYTLAVIKLYIEKHFDDKVIVALNTDSNPLVDLVKYQNILEDIQIIPRKGKLAGDRVAKVGVVKDTYLNVCATSKIDVVVDLDLTSPFRDVFDIENCIAEYQSNIDYDLVVSVVHARRSPYFNMVEKKGSFYHKICDSNYTTRQEAPAVYELNASIYAYRPVFLESEITNNILDNRCGVYVMDDYLVLDIDSEEDFRMMEFLLTYYSKQDTGLAEVYKLARQFVTD